MATTQEIFLGFAKQIKRDILPALTDLQEARGATPRYINGLAQLEATLRAAGLFPEIFYPTYVKVNEETYNQTHIEHTITVTRPRNQEPEALTSNPHFARRDLKMIIAIPKQGLDQYLDTPSALTRSAESVAMRRSDLRAEIERPYLYFGLVDVMGVDTSTQSGNFNRQLDFRNVFGGMILRPEDHLKTIEAVRANRSGKFTQVDSTGNTETTMTIDKFKDAFRSLTEYANAFNRGKGITARR